MPDRYPRLTALKDLIAVPKHLFPDERGLVELTLYEVGERLVFWRECPADLISILKRPEGAPKFSAPAYGVLPTIGNINSHPIFAALSAKPPSRFEPVGRAAQAALLLATFILQANEKLKDYEASLRPASLSCRRVCFGEYSPRGFSEALVASKSLLDLCKGIERVRASGGPFSAMEVRVMNGLHSLVADSLQLPSLKPSRIRPRVTRSGPKKADEGTPEHEYFEEPEHQPTDEDISEGAAPVPECPGRRMVVVKLPSVFCDAAISPQQQMMIAKTQARAISASSQGLLLTSERLQLVDLEALEAAVGALVQGDKKSNPALRRGALAACISLFSGRSLEKLKEVISVATREHLPPGDLPAPVIVVSEQALVFSMPKIEGFCPSDTDANWYWSVKERVVLPLPAGLACSQIIVEQAKTQIGSRLMEGAGWEADFEAFIRAVNDEKRSRLTATRIAHFVARQIVALNGDWADAALVGGTGDANARLFYYCPRQTHLQGVWRELWDGVAKGLGRELGMAMPDEKSDYRVGSCGCPTPEAVAHMVKALIKHCDSVSRGRRSRDRMRKIHNAITVYTCLMVLWHTGIRGVNQPVELQLFDEATGFLGVSDKDTDVFYSSRLTWLTTTSQRQIAAYKSHLRGMRAHFGSDDIPEDALFFLDENFKQIPLTKAAIRSNLPPDYPFRLNSQRHYLRTMLREKGVRAQVVDAMLGHGAPGQEPYAKHSCLSPQRLRIEAGPALTQLSDMAKWRVLNGLSA